MLKIEELVHTYINTHCNFEKDFILTNFFHSDWEADILLINQQGLSHEIEIKLSKSDFRNDFKKFYTNQKTGEKFLKHDKIGCGDYICNQFSFLIPMGIIDYNEIPEHCGIIEFYHDEDHWETTFHYIRQPKTIHSDPYWKFCDKEQFFRSLARNLLIKKFELKGKKEELIFKNPMDYKK